MCKLPVMLTAQDAKNLYKEHNNSGTIGNVQCSTCGGTMFFRVVDEEVFVETSCTCPHKNHSRDRTAFHIAFTHKRYAIECDWDTVAEWYNDEWKDKGKKYVLEAIKGSSKVHITI